MSLVWIELFLSNISKDIMEINIYYCIMFNCHHAGIFIIVRRQAIKLTLQECYKYVVIKIIINIVRFAKWRQ